MTSNNETSIQCSSKRRGVYVKTCVEVSVSEAGIKSASVFLAAAAVVVGILAFLYVK
jgi:hypothetical protein